ncbi:hypothetical protein Q7O_002981 [Pectobacterium carotovorum subsp. carotovorum PCCS1]|nr:hypothetical protein [Pectobacterium carotovorum subsp. carotovorum PCCS1]
MLRDKISCQKSITLLFMLFSLFFCPILMAKRPTIISCFFMPNDVMKNA